MTKLRDRLSELCDHLLFLDEEAFDTAIIGVAEQAGGAYAVAYDESKVLNVLVGMGMDEEEAQEYYDFNIACAFMGEHTPVFVRPVSAYM